MAWMIFITSAVWIYWILYWITARKRRIARRMDDLSVYRFQAATSQAGSRRVYGSQKSRPTFTWRRLVRMFTTNWVSRWSSARLEEQQRKLLQAGNPLFVNIAEWMGLRFLFAMLGALAGLGMASLVGGIRGLVFLLVLALLGWIGPEFWLSRRVTLRQAELFRSFPNMIDLLTVSVEAGLGFDQALDRVASKMKGALAEEVSRTLREMQLGSTRVEALSRLAYRTGVHAIQLFVSSVVQAERLGISMGNVLRVQADEVRRARKMAAQEKAMKAPVKILFPLIAFVFPSIFIVILGPAVIQIMHTFAHR